MANPDKVPIFAFEIDTYHYVFSNGTIPSSTTPTKPWFTDAGPDDLILTVNDLEGGADLQDLVVHVQDLLQAITADFPTFVFEGKTMFLKAGWGHIDPITLLPVADTDYGDFATLFTGKIDSVESENANNDYSFTCPDIRVELAKVIFTVGDDGFPTDSSHPKTLNGHPLDILLEILETEVGLLTSQIDLAKIAQYRALYSGMQMTFSTDSPPVAKEFIEAEILKPMAAYHRSNNLGQFTVDFFYPIDLTPVYNFTPDNLADIPEAGQADLINQVEVRMDYDGSNFLAQPLEQSAPSIAKYGMYGLQTIDSKGLRSGLNGEFWGKLTAFLIFLRYSNKALLHGDNGKNTASNPINALWDACLLEPGDLVTMTHPDVPDRVAGVKGITNKTYVVMDRTWQFFAGNVQLKLLEIDLTKFKQYLITGNAEAAYTAASGADQAALMFQSDATGHYSNGNVGNTLG